MRITAALGLLSIMAFAAPAFSQSFVGEWTATAAAPGGNTSENIKVAKVGSNFAITSEFAATAPAGMPLAGPGVDIVLDKDHFSYKRTVTVPGSIIVLTYTGVVSGDKFTGTAEMGGIKIPYTGVRIKHGG